MRYHNAQSRNTFSVDIPFNIRSAYLSFLAGFAHILKNLLGHYGSRKVATKRIWRLPDVLNQTGLSRSTIYEMIGRGEFPRQVKLGPRAVGWSSDDVVAWIESRIEYSQVCDSGRPAHLFRTNRAPGS